MILLLIVGAAAFLIGVFTGSTMEWLRVLSYLDRNLDLDPDWLRSGIAADEHRAGRR